MNLITADGILGVRCQPKSNGPLIKRQWRVFHDRVDLDSELATRVLLCALLAFALPAIIFGAEILDVGGPASGAADHAIWPAGLGEEIVGSFQVGEILNRLQKCLRILLFNFHARILTKCGHLVKYIITTEIYKRCLPRAQPA